MSMSFDTALSGINASSTDLSVIGNNVANSNTVGFKFSRTEFADLYSATLQSSSATNPGIGVKVQDIAQQYSQGTNTATGNNLDLAISGDGFFRVTDTNGQNTLYTRNGAFHLDKNNNVVNAQGQFLSSANQTKITIAPSMSASATTNVTAAMNLNAAETVPTASSYINLSGLRLNLQDAVPTDPTFLPTDKNSYNLQTSTTIYDSVGVPHTAYLYFAKASTNFDGNALNSNNATVPVYTWNVHMVVDGNEVFPTGNAAGGASQIAFDPNSGQYLGVIDVNGQPSLSSNAYTVSGANNTNPFQVALTGLNSSTQTTLYADPSQAAPVNTTFSAADPTSYSSGPVPKVVTNPDGSTSLAGGQNIEQIIDSNGATHFVGLYYASDGPSTNQWTLHSVLLNNKDGTPAVDVAGNPLPELSTNAAFLATVKVSLNPQTGVFSTQPTSFQYNISSAENNGGSPSTFTLPVLQNNGDIQPTITNDGNTGASWVQPAGGSLPSASSTPPSYNYSTSTTLYDSQGNAQQANLYFVKTGTNSWSVHTFVQNPGTNPTTYQELTNSNNTLGVSLTFNVHGVLQSTQPASVPPGKFSLTGTSPGGVTPPAFTMDLSQSTQYGGPYSVQSLSQDGYASGTLNGVNIDPKGNVKGTYSNGQSWPLTSDTSHQIALVTFRNLNGLSPVGNTEWAQTPASGGEVSTVSTVQSGSLESSNVDLTAQLVNMIVAQRSFQANAQVISAVDTLTQTIVNLR